MEQGLTLTSKIGNWISTIILGNTKEVIARMDERIISIQTQQNDMKVEIHDTKSKLNILFEKVSEITPKLDILWKASLAPAHSPRQLSTFGQSILETSGIREIVTIKRSELLQRIRQQNISNPYDADNVIVAVMAKFLEYYPEYTEELKTGAFKSGVDINTVLYVGSVYLRDRIFPELGFSLTDMV